jgi:predicted TIM-barrel fold metal-dependent hydrolase
MQTPWGELAVRDAHCHFFSRRFFDGLAGQAGRSAAEIAKSLNWVLPPEDPGELARTWVSELDRYRVESAALIASLPGDEASVCAAKEVCPGRFRAFSMVNPMAGHAVFAGLDAICLFPAMHRYSMHDAAAIFEQAEAAGCVVFVHCGVLTVGVRKKLGLASPFDLRFSNPADLHAIALRHPRVPFILPHFGAGYFREALMLADLCPNVYLDTSSSNSWMRYEGLDLATVFRRALSVVGPKRLLFGSDSSFFPRGWNREVIDAQIQVLSSIGVERREAGQILGGNLIDLFRER